MLIQQLSEAHTSPQRGLGGGGGVIQKGYEMGEFLLTYSYKRRRGMFIMIHAHIAQANWVMISIEYISFFIRISCIFCPEFKELYKKFKLSWIWDLFERPRLQNIFVLSKFLVNLMRLKNCRISYAQVPIQINLNI